VVRKGPRTAFSLSVRACETMNSASSAHPASRAYWLYSLSHPPPGELLIAKCLLLSDIVCPAGRAGQAAEEPAVWPEQTTPCRQRFASK